MAIATEQSATRRRGDAGAGFFLPDLCASRSVVIMVILSELLVVVFVLGDSALPALDWGEFALSSLFVQWIVLLSSAFLCAARRLLAGLSLPLAVAASLLIILLVTLASSLTAQYLLEGNPIQRLDSWWLLRNQLMAAVIGGIVLRYFILQQQLRVREQAELTARIESLRSKIRPHFLFNTMNSIASLIGSRPEEAEQVVEDLSELLRASLVENPERATLADELRLCEIYLRIEQLRLGERMKLRWDVDEAALGCPLPALLLQPLIENAVYHGVARLPKGGEISIRAKLEDDRVRVEVINPLPDVTGRDGGGHQMALDNIRERLEAHYGDRGTLDLNRSAARFEVTLTIPRELDEAGA
jgi:two-component system sensor histidine kinase AlgZ